MRKSYLLLLSALLPALGAFAETVHVTEENGIGEAVKNAVTGDEIILDVDQKTGDRLQISDKNITIKGATASIRIYWNNSNNSLFQIYETGALTLADVHIDGSLIEKKTIRKQAIEIKDNADVTFDNVQFDYLHSNSDNGVINVKGNAKALFNGCYFTSSYTELTGNKQKVGAVVVDNDNVTVGGFSGGGYAFYLKKALNALNFDGYGLNIYLAKGCFSNGSIVVKGSTKVKGFKLKDAGRKAVLEVDGDNLVFNDNCIHVTTEDGLKDALENAKDDDIFILDVNQSVKDRLSISDKKIEIQGATQDIKISYTSNNNTLFQVSGKGVLALNELTVDGSVVQEKTYRKQAIEVKDSADVTFNKVAFVQMHSNQSNGLVNVTGASAAGFKDCTFTECFTALSATDTVGAVFVSNENVKVEGKTNASFYLRKTLNAADYTGASDLYLEPGAFATGSILVKGATEGFTLKGAGEKATLEVVDGNLVYNDGCTHVTTADGLKAAVDTAVNGEIIIVDLNQSVSARMQITDKKISIKGANKDVTISYTNNNNTLFQVSGKGGLALSDITVDGSAVQEQKYNKQAIEVKDSTEVSFTNVAFVKMHSNQSNGLINVTGKAVAGFKDCTFAECFTALSATDTVGAVFVSNENVTVEGKTDASFYLRKALNAANYTGTSVLYLAPETFANGAVLVNGATEGFTLAGLEDAELEAVEGNLVLKLKESAVAVIELDPEAPVDVYNMQGIAVKKGVKAAEAAEGLPAGIYIIGGHKVLVR